MLCSRLHMYHMDSNISTKLHVSRIFKVEKSMKKETKNKTKLTCTRLCL